MAENSLYPACVKLDYHSPYGAHTMTIPTKAWSGEIGIGGSGSFETWEGGLHDAVDMITDLANLLKVFYKPDHFIDQFTIYTLASPTAPPVPVAGGVLSIEGTEASSHWSKAVQTTMSIRTTAFGQMKIILLDAPVPNSFDKINSFDVSAEAEALMDNLALTTNGWAGRDGARPLTMTQIAYTLNEKLRREYNMN